MKRDVEPKVPEIKAIFIAAANRTNPLEKHEEFVLRLVSAVSLACVRTAHSLFRECLSGHLALPGAFDGTPNEARFARSPGEFLRR